MIAFFSLLIKVEPAKVWVLFCILQFCNSFRKSGSTETFFFPAIRCLRMTGMMKVIRGMACGVYTIVIQQGRG